MSKLMLLPHVSLLLLTSHEHLLAETAAVVQVLLLEHRP